MPFKERGQIKYLTSSFKNANKKGILTPYLFWMFAKTICNGSIKKSEFTKAIKGRLKISDSLISRYKKKCLELEFFNETHSHINLVSQQKAWSILGFDIFEPNEKGNIKWNSNKILKICIRQAKTIEQLKYIIIIQETQFNAFLQLKISEIKSGKKDKNDLIYTSGSKAVQASCKKIAKNFGYKSLMTGSRLRKSLDKLEVINLIKTESCLIKRGVKFSDFKFMLCKDNSLHWFMGNVFKKLCDLIFFREAPYHKASLIINSI